MQQAARKPSAEPDQKWSLSGKPHTKVTQAHGKRKGRRNVGRLHRLTLAKPRKARGCHEHLPDLFDDLEAHKTKTTIEENH